MPTKDFYALLTRLFLGYIFMSSGLCKLTDGQFGQLIGPPHLINDLAPHGLRLFGLFIASSQVLAGALVMSQRYSPLGLIMLVPMNLSILMVTISQQWQGTPYVNAVFLLLNVLVLLYEWQSLKYLVLTDDPSPWQPFNTSRLFPNRWLPIGMLLTVLGSIITSQYNQVMTMLLATASFLLTYLNIWPQPQLTSLNRAVLVLSLVAILSVTFGDWVKGIVNPVITFAIAITLILVLLIVSAIRNTLVGQGIRAGH